MPELNFGEEHEEKENEQEDAVEGEEEQEEGSEGGEEAEPESGGRLANLESKFEELVEYIRATQGQKEAAKAERAIEKAMDKPNFGDNTVGSALWDRLDHLEKTITSRYEREENEKRQQAAAEGEWIRFKDDASRYVAGRVAKGDPEVKLDDVLEVVAEMGILANKRVPVHRALERAYNAVAYESAKSRARERGIVDSTKPSAKLPTFTKPKSARETARGAEETARPSSPINRLKKEMEEANAKLGKVSKEEMEDAFGGF